MRLEDLQELIFSDLTIIKGKERYEDVWKLGGVFNKFKLHEVIGIRANEGAIVVCIKEHI